MRKRQRPLFMGENHAKALKENNMNGILAQRSEESILNINAGTDQKAGKGLPVNRAFETKIL